MRGRCSRRSPPRAASQTVIATHWHPDHWMTYDAVRAATGAPVLAGSSEINIPEERIDGRLEDGAEVRWAALGSA